MIECDICCFEFSESRLPKILTKCGHSFCESCIGSMHKDNFVECPHCRVATHLRDVRTNFALSTHVDENRPVCPLHQLTVKQFCSTCWLFVCAECLTHSSHTFLTLTEGVELVKAEIEKTSERNKAIHVLQKEKRQVEEIKFKSISATIEKTAAQCVAQYEQVVAQLHTEMTSAVSLLEEYKKFMRKRLNHEEEAGDLLTKIGNISGNFFEYLESRKSIRQSLLWLEKEYRTVDEEFDRIRIDGNFSEDISTVVPNITFSMPQGPFIVIHNIPPVHAAEPVRQLHRSTSNGALAETSYIL